MKPFTLLSLLIISLSILVCSPLFGQPHDTKAERAFDVAKGMFTDQLYDLAADQFRNFLQTYPNSSYSEEAQFLLAESHFQMNDFSRAATAFKELLTEYPAVGIRDKAQIRLIETLVRSNRTQEALQTLSMFLDQYPKSEFIPNAYYWKGEALYQNGNYMEALQAYERVSATDAGHELADYALYSQGYIYEEMEKWDNAHRMYRALLERFPTSPLAEQAAYRIGFSSFGNHDYRQTIEHLSHALEQFPKCTLRGEAQYFIGESFYRLKQFDKAIKAYRIISSLTDNDFADDAVYSLGWAYAEIGQHEKAIEAFSTVPQVSQDRRLVASAIFQSGRHLLITGNATRAKQAFRTVFTDYDKSADAANALYEYASIEFDFEDYDNARSYFEKLVKSYPSSSLVGEASVMIGECYLATSELQSAEDKFRASFETYDTPHVRGLALYKIARTQFLKGEYKKAVVNLKAVLRAFSDQDVAKDALFWKAEALFKQDAFPDAFSDYRSFVERYPESSRIGEAYYGLGYTALQLGRFTRAADAFKKASLYGSKDIRWDAKLRQGDALFNAKAFSRAIATYESVLKSTATVAQKAEAQFQIGNSYYRRQRWQQARNAFQTVVNTYSSSSLAPESLYMSGRSAFRSENYPQAIQDFETLVDRFPESEFRDDATYAIGDSYYNQEQYERAAERYRRLIDIFPKSEYVEDAVTGLQWSLMQMGQSQEALDVVDELAMQIKEPSRAADIFSRKAEFFYQSQKYDQAVGQYRLVLREYPDSKAAQNAYFAIGQAYLKMDNTEQAMEAFAEQQQSYPEAERTPDAALYRADLLFQRKEYQKAIGLYQDIQDRFPSHPNTALAGYKIGLAYLEQNDYQNAQSTFSRVINSDSDSRATHLARIGLAQVFITLKRYPAALEQLEAIVAKADPDIAAQAQVLMGDAYRGQNDLQAAIVAYLKTKYLYGNQTAWVAKSLYSAAQCNEELGRMGDARRLYQNILNNYASETEWAQNAKNRLNSLVGQ